MTSRIDILVRGAGPVGCVAALLLRSHCRVGILGADAGTAAFRPIVLSYASRLILERVGAWDALDVTPIEAIQVSQAGGFGRTRFDAADCAVPALGYVLEYAALLGALRTRVADLVIKEDPGSRLVVHAEGAAPEAEEKRYGQDALVAAVRFAPPAGSTAYERFTPEGPLALLPLGARHALVWSLRPDRARELAAAPEAEFLAALARAAGTRPGHPIAVEGRSVQPLVLRVQGERVGERRVYIGNAAQTLHPVAGQGLNVGLRDAWELARIVRDKPDPGAPAVLARFAARRSTDAGAAVRVTDLLARGFLDSGRLARAARGAALTALDLFPAPRRFFARRMIFGPSALP